MKTPLFLGLVLMVNLQVFAQPVFQNPVTQEWLAEKLNGRHPRLILTPEVAQQIQGKLKNDPEVKQYFRLLDGLAAQYVALPSLTYKKTGRRLLGVSREAIRRMATLALVYRFEKKEPYLRKLEEEIMAVAAFEDWNPSHFLDVAEMATALAFALDWAGEWLEPSVKRAAVEAIADKALKPGIAVSEDNWWKVAHHNWNLVCHGGLAIGALTIFEEEPELASAILHQSVEKIPLGLQPYAPDGIYPEGPSYWFYATDYLTMAISVFESTLQTDFGFTDAPGITESALYSQITAGPTGDYFNFFDARRAGFQSLGHFGLLAWFSQRGMPYFDQNAYSRSLSKQSYQNKGSRFSAIHFIHLAQLATGDANNKALPKVWSGQGDSPIGVMREGNADGFYLAAKGGRAADNHGNMDAGSFIFEWKQIRWSIDPGNQDYNELEQKMGTGALWDGSQDSERWTLLTKGNHGHSTLTINGAQHQVDGRAELVQEALAAENPFFTFDLTPVFQPYLSTATRTFRKVTGSTVEVIDSLQFSAKTETITWQLITEADVKVNKRGIQLRQNGVKLSLEVLNEEEYAVEVVPLSPPPLAYDKDILGLKRVEVHFNRSAFSGNEGVIRVRLNGSN